MPFINKSLPRLLAFFLNMGIQIPPSLIIPLESFIQSSPERTTRFLLSANPKSIELLAQKKIPLVVNEAIKRTPALKDLYLKNGVRIEEIRTMEDLKKLPETNKENYTKTYPLEQRCIDGRAPSTGNIYESAGTSGKPTIWLQSLSEINAFKSFVCFSMDYTYRVYSRRYILLNCWAFGTWPTAIDFSFSSEEFSEVVNIGTDTDKVIEVLKSLGTDKKYIITGYPPFLRNLIDEGKEKGIDWKKYKLDIVTGGEGFVEEWRDNISSKLAEGAIIRSAYGTSDKGLGEGFETELTVAVRRIARIVQTYIHDGEEEAKKLSKRDFGAVLLPSNKEKAASFLRELFKVDPISDSRLPMIFQYDPTVYFEEEVIGKNPEGKEIREWVTTVLKEEMAIPRIRFNVNDEGGLLSFSEVEGIFDRNLMKFENILGIIGVDKKRILPLPFFFIFGRSDGTISIDGSNIYPEEIWSMIESIPRLDKAINSFVMFITQDHRLGMSFELKKGARIFRGDYYKDAIKRNLAHYSMGFKANVDARLKSSNLEINFYEFGRGPFSDSPSTKSRVKYVYTAQRVKKT